MIRFLVRESTHVSDTWGFTLYYPNYYNIVDFRVEMLAVISLVESWWKAGREREYILVSGRLSTLGDFFIY